MRCLSLTQQKHVNPRLDSYHQNSIVLESCIYLMMVFHSTSRKKTHFMVVSY